VTGEALAGQIAEVVATALVHGTILAALTGAIVRCLRRARPALLAALWTVALVKFATPVAPAAPFSLSSLFPDAVSVTASAQAIGISRGAGTIVAGAAEGARGMAAWWPMLVTGAVALWLVGIALVLARRAGRAHRLRARVATMALADAELRASVERASAVIGVRRVPPVRVDASAAGAYLVGWLRPILVVPAWARGLQRDAILLHELAHLRRRDPLVKALQRLVTALLFFWPPVRWVSRQIDLLREQACDEWAVTRGHLRAADYARMLVAVAERAAGAPRLGAQLAFAPRPGHLERRVVHLMTRRHRPGLSLLMLVVVLGWSAIALAGAERGAHAPRAELLCATDPRIGQQILASYPDADTDGDGSLSKDEVCAHQLRMQRKLVDAVVHRLPEDRLRLADLDGDGSLSPSEIAALKSRLTVAVRSDAETRQSRLVLQYEQVSRLEGRSDFAWVEDSQFELATAEVAGAVCEEPVGRCVEDERALTSEEESFLLIDVAVRGDD